MLKINISPNYSYKFYSINKKDVITNEVTTITQ